MTNKDAADGSLSTGLFLSDTSDHILMFLYTHNLLLTCLDLKEVMGGLNLYVQHLSVKL